MARTRHHRRNEAAGQHWDRRGSNSPQPQTSAGVSVQQLLALASTPVARDVLCNDLDCAPKVLEGLIGLAKEQGIDVLEEDGTITAIAPTPQPRSNDQILDEHKRDTQRRLDREERSKLIEELEHLRRRQSVIDQIGAQKIPTIVRRETASGMREATAVVQCSDWHVEEPVEPEKVNGLNEYSLEIAAERINRLIDGALWLLEMHSAKFRIKDMILWLGGDLMTGHIHEDLAESSQLSPVETILWLQKKIVMMIDTLLARTELETIHVPCNYGNHSRTTHKKRIMLGAENSFEWLMYQQLANLYEERKEKRVIFSAPKSIHVYTQVYDFLVRGTHGDSTSYQGGIGGLTIPLNKAIAMWDLGHRADITNFGHWHQELSLRNMAGNSSLIGYSPYSIEIKARYEPPTQNFYLIDSKRFKCCSTPIWVDAMASHQRVA